MGLNSIHITVMVLSDRSDKAIKYMKKLVADSGEEIIHIREYDGIIDTVTKRYRASWFSPNIRGYRYREVYIDKCLLEDDETIHLISMKLVPPHYYVGVEKDENYNWRDHVHYFECE